MSDILKKTAKKLADIMVEHLSALDPKDRNAKIEAGKKVLRKSTKLTPGSSDRCPKGSSNVGIARSPLAARGR